MRFGISIDRMQLFWSDGDRDLAHAFAEMEGFALVRQGTGYLEPYRVLGGWEQRVEYATGTKSRERERERKRRNRKEAACAG